LGCPRMNCGNPASYKKKGESLSTKEGNQRKRCAKVVEWASFKFAKRRPWGKTIPVKKAARRGGIKLVGIPKRTVRPWQNGISTQHR